MNPLLSFFSRGKCYEPKDSHKANRASIVSTFSEKLEFVTGFMREQVRSAQSILTTIRLCTPKTRVIQLADGWSREETVQMKKTVHQDTTQFNIPTDIRAYVIQQVRSVAKQMFDFLCQTAGAHSAELTYTLVAITGTSLNATLKLMAVNDAKYLC